MLQHQQSPLPNAAFLASMQVGDLMKAAARMQAILEQEKELLAQFRYRELMQFKDEKAQLAKTLESYQRVLAVDASLLEKADDATREKLVSTAENLSVALQENLKKTTLALSVNERVMKTITEAVSEHSRVNVYGRSGQTSTAGQAAISINLNQKA